MAWLREKQTKTDKSYLRANEKEEEKTIKGSYLLSEWNRT